jgi:hypothetical protein
MALVLCGLFVASAQAEQRSSTCVPEAGAYSDAHCVNKTGSGGFNLVEISSGTEINTTATNAKTASETKAAAPEKMRGALSGVEVEFECASASGTGTLLNGTTSSTATGTLTYSDCIVTKPAGRGCAIKGGSVTTNKLKSTTAGQTGANVKVEPASGTELGSVPLEGCLANKPPSANYPATGSFVASTSGATQTTTEAAITAQGTFLLGGNLVGAEGALTISKSGGNPIT